MRRSKPGSRTGGRNGGELAGQTGGGGGAAFLCFSGVAHTPSACWFPIGLDERAFTVTRDCKQCRAVDWWGWGIRDVFSEKLQGFLDSTLYPV